MLFNYGITLLLATSLSFSVDALPYPQVVGSIGVRQLGDQARASNAKGSADSGSALGRRPVSSPVSNKGPIQAIGGRSADGLSLESRSIADRQLEGALGKIGKSPKGDGGEARSSQAKAKSQAKSPSNDGAAKSVRGRSANNLSPERRSLTDRGSDAIEKIKHAFNKGPSPTPVAAPRAVLPREDNPGVEVRGLDSENPHVESRSIAHRQINALEKIRNSFNKGPSPTPVAGPRGVSPREGDLGVQFLGAELEGAAGATPTVTVTTTVTIAAKETLRSE